MKSIFTTKRVTAGLLIVLLVYVWVQLPGERWQGQLSNNDKIKGVTVSSEVEQAAPRLAAAFASSVESEVVQIATPSTVVQPLTPVADVDSDTKRKKVGKVKITQDTLDRITRGKESLVAVPLFDGEVIQVQLEERQPLGLAGTLVYGKVQGEPNSRVHFSIVKHAMVASFILEDGREFKMSSMPQGKHEYQLAEIDTIAVLRHQKFPGVPGPVHTGYVNGEKVIALPSYVVAIPKNQMPLRKMLGEEVWDREMKMVDIQPDHDGLTSRVKLRRPYVEAGRPDNIQSSEKIPSGLMASLTQQAQVQPVGLGGGGWVINKYGQWQKKPVVGQRGSGGGVSVGFWYTPKVETLFGDAAKVGAEAGTRIAAANQANKDSGLSFSFGMAGSAYRISKEFDGTQINASLDYITPWRNNDTAVNKA
ncbi:MAG: hypothetical protein VYD34_00650, partial [Verrucomicrobiota bacterium]|nr:hypothetical protein [Verrucomicrobiota bacterium]